MTGGERPLSVVVVTYDMERELPRTLRSLSADLQVGVEASDYEVSVVDNGSPRPVDPGRFADLAGTYRFERIDPAPPSPARAANLGIGLATGETIGLIVDGARIASPGLLHMALQARRLDDRPVIASLGWHLGTARHMEAAESGFDQAAEDDLLARSGWEEDGYRLFGISTLGGSSAQGWFLPISESSALFLPAALWRELGGLDEAFVLPGGGLVNHDLYRRAVELDGTRLVTLLGEGTFHQYHGGAATSGRHGWDEMDADYQRLRGTPYRKPAAPSLYVGTMPPAALGHLDHSSRAVRAKLDRASARRAWWRRLARRLRLSAPA